MGVFLNEEDKGDGKIWKKSEYILRPIQWGSLTDWIQKASQTENKIKKQRMFKLEF